MTRRLKDSLAGSVQYIRVAMEHGGKIMRGSRAGLPRISNQRPAAVARRDASAAVHVEKVLDVLLSQPPRIFRGARCIQTALQSLAAEPGEKSGLGELLQ